MKCLGVYWRCDTCGTADSVTPWNCPACAKEVCETCFYQYDYCGKCWANLSYEQRKIVKKEFNE